MSRTHWRLAVLLLLCCVSLGAAAKLRQRMQRSTEEAERGLTPAQAEDQRELAELWRKPAVKPVSTMQQVSQDGGTLSWRCALFSLKKRLRRGVSRAALIELGPPTWGKAALPKMPNNSRSGGSSLGREKSHAPSCVQTAPGSG